SPAHSKTVFQTNNPQNTMSASLYRSLQFFLQSYGHHPYLHSFPTRRSSDLLGAAVLWQCGAGMEVVDLDRGVGFLDDVAGRGLRSEEHTSELQSQSNLVCRLLLEKKNTSPSAFRSSSVDAGSLRPTLHSPRP